jgi:hypothetical protein
MARNQIVGNSGNTAEVASDGSQLMQLTGSKVVEQKTQANAPIVFAQNVQFIEIYNTDNANTGVFTVNGIPITVPPDKSFKSQIGGTPSKNITVTGSTSYILTRYE